MNDPETNPPGQEVLFLGVKGSGKTVFLSVLGKRFEQEGPLGLCLVPEAGTATDDFVTEVSLRLSEGRFPAATGRSERMLLRWSVRSGSRTLFSLSSMDCAGETILDAFCEDGDGDGEDGSSNYDDELVVTHSGRSEKAVAETLRAMADRAAAICLVLNPNDFPSNVRRAVQEDPDLKRDFEERFKAMRRLSLAIAQNPSFSDKKLFVLLTQAGDEAVRSGLESTGDPASYIEAEFPALLRSAPEARCLAVSAVNEVEETVDDRTGRVVTAPASGFTSSGLTEFLVRVGGELGPALSGVAAAWNALRDAERADSMARSSVRYTAPDRLAAAAARLAAAEALEAACRGFLDSDPSRPDPTGRTEAEIEPIVLAARRRLEAERVLDGWLRPYAISKMSGSAPDAAAPEDFWRRTFDEVLDDANEALTAVGGPDAAFSRDRFWGVADPAWLHREADGAVRRLLADLGALSDAISAGDEAETDRLFAVCSANWRGAPGLDELAAKRAALSSRRARERAEAAKAAAAADLKAAAADRRRRIALGSVAAAAVAGACAFGWGSMREKTLRDGRTAWDRAANLAADGRFSEAVRLAATVTDAPFFLVRRKDLVDADTVATWANVPDDYASRVAAAVKAMDEIGGLKRALERDFSAEDLKTEKVGQFARAVSAAAAAMPGPDMVDALNIPSRGVDPSKPAAALTNAVARAKLARSLHDDARESAARRRAERLAAENVIRRDASNAVARLLAEGQDFMREFAAEDRAGNASAKYLASRSDALKRLDDATRSGSIDGFRAIPGAVGEARELAVGATAEAVAARKARQAREAEARAVATAVRDEAGKKRNSWLADFSEDDRGGAESARAEVVWRNAVAAFDAAGARETGVAAAYEEAAKEFERASRVFDSAIGESRTMKEKRLAAEEEAQRLAREAEARRRAEEEAARKRAEEERLAREAAEAEARRLAEEAREKILSGVAAAAARRDIPDILGSVPEKDRAEALSRWCDALLALPEFGENGPSGEAALEDAMRLADPYFRAAGVDPGDESSANPLAGRIRGWAGKWAEKAESAAKKCLGDDRAKDFGWSSALECEKFAGLVERNPCASGEARGRSEAAVADLPGFFVIAATSGGRPVDLPDKVKTPSKTAAAKDPSTGASVAVCRLDAGMGPILRFERHLGGARVPGVPRLVHGTNRFTVEF